MDRAVFSSRLREARERKGYKQGDLAVHTGATPQAISAYETGTRAPSVDALITLATALDVSVDWLLGLESKVGKPNNTPKTLRDLYNAITEIAKLAPVHPIGSSTGGIGIHIEAPGLSKFYHDRDQMLRLIKQGVIDEALFSTWEAGAIAQMAEIPAPRFEKVAKNGE